MDSCGKFVIVLLVFYSVMMGLITIESPFWKHLYHHGKPQPGIFRAYNLYVALCCGLKLQNCIFHCFCWGPREVIISYISWKL